MAQVLGADIARVQVGDAATVDTGDGGAPLTGKVTNVGAVMNPDTRSGSGSYARRPVTLINRIIALALEQPLLIVLLSLALAGAGA